MRMSAMRPLAQAVGYADEQHDMSQMPGMKTP
jgi:hypothetical protein